MIPKIAHFFWAGESMSLMRFLTLASFRHHNPLWGMVLHMPAERPGRKTWSTPEQQETYNGSSSENWLGKVTKLGVQIRAWVPPHSDLPVVHASDMFAWDVLATIGGLYCDMDILFVAPVEHSISNDKMTYDAWLCFYQCVFPIGFLAATPGNQFFRDVRNVAAGRGANTYQSMGCEAGTATIHHLPTFAETTDHALPKARVNAIQTHYKYRVLNFERKVVYPWPPHHTLEILQNTHTSLPDVTIGIHWYGGHPHSQDLNRQLTCKNLGEINNTFTHHARSIPLP